MKLDPRNPISRFFIPRYDELTLFLMSLAFLLLFCTEADLRSDFLSFRGRTFDPRDYLFLAIFAAGILFSIYHVFTRRPKSDLEKAVMLVFAITVSALSGICAGRHMLENSHGLLLVFPAWNILNGVLLFLMYRFDFIDETNIVDGNATPLQVILGALVVVLALFVCRFFFEMYWAATFSICVSYATNINGTLQAFFSKPTADGC